ncbi:MAG: hypothetical protein IJ165_11850 [Proteobacteria bacterium]|nr:hypothetical protein [Pseudomonadota bacterium]
MIQNLRDEADYDIIAVEPASCPSFTRGTYAYAFCDTGKICPFAKMYTLGPSFMPSPIRASGLRYHGMSPSSPNSTPQKQMHCHIRRTDQSSKPHKYSPASKASSPPPNPPTPSRPSTNYNLHSPRTRVAADTCALMIIDKNLVNNYFTMG